MPRALLLQNLAFQKNDARACDDDICRGRGLTLEWNGMLSLCPSKTQRAQLFSRKFSSAAAPTCDLSVVDGIPNTAALFLLPILFGVFLLSLIYPKSLFVLLGPYKR